MSVADDIKKNSADTFGTKWTVRDGQVVPDASDLKLANDAALAISARRLRKGWLKAGTA